MEAQFVVERRDIHEYQGVSHQAKAGTYQPSPTILLAVASPENHPHDPSPSLLLLFPIGPIHAPRTFLRSTHPTLTEVLRNESAFRDELQK